MMNTKLLLTGSLSMLLLTSSLTAQEGCTEGACFIDLSNLKHTKEFREKKIKFVSSKRESRHHSSFVMIQEMSGDKSFDIVMDGKLTIVFPSYLMNDEEKANYYAEQKAIALNQKANKEANRELERVIQPIENVGDKILNRNLPTSDYFCDNHKEPVQVENSTSLYECV